MKKEALNIIVIIVITGLLLTGCMTNGLSGVSHGTFTQSKSDTLVKELIIKEHHEKIVLDVSIEAKKGKIELIILKPNGEEFFNKDITGENQYREKLTIKDPLPGTWEIKTILEDAVGEYRYKISGN